MPSSGQLKHTVLPSPTRVCLLALLCGACLTSATACGSSPGEPGSGTGSYSTAIMGSFFGSLMLTLSGGERACGDWQERDEFYRQGGLWLRLLAIDATDLAPRQDRFSYPIDAREPVPAHNEFLALEVPELVTGQFPDIQSEAFLGGSVELDAVPDYDTGQAAGRYEISVDGTDYSGTFNTAYCPTAAGVDTATIAIDLWAYCDLTSDIPYAPGATTADADPRDLERGLKTIGFSAEEGDCFQTVIDVFCKSSPPVHWPDDGRNDCLSYELNKCRGYAEPPPELCVAP